MKSVSIQINKDEHNKDNKFSLKITYPALELTNIQAGINDVHLQVPGGGTQPNGVGSELTFFKNLLRSLFFYSWFRLPVDSDPL